MNEKQIQNELEKKQQFLREEIMNKNYDVEEFSEFMSKFKENGLDLVNWTFNELKDAVELFKNRGKSKEEEQKEIEKGVENIRQSFLLNKDDYPDLDNSNNSNDKNNCININYDYKVINYQNARNSNIFNNNCYDSNANNNKRLENNNTINQKGNNNLVNDNNSNIINNEVLNENKINKTNVENRPKEFREFEIVDESNFNNEKMALEKIPCLKQSQNSLTNNNNLYVELDS